MSDESIKKAQDCCKQLEDEGIIDHLQRAAEIMHEYGVAGIGVRVEAGEHDCMSIRIGNGADLFNKLYQDGQ